MRKALVILVMLVLVGAGFMSCGGSSKKVVVNVMAYGDNSNPEGVNWVRLVDAFEKANPNIDIDYEMLYDQAYWDKVPARIAAGQIPDMAYFTADAKWGSPWKEAGQFFDHKKYLDAKKYDFDLIPPMGSNGEIYSVPLGTSNICTTLYMNQSLLKELGLEAPKTYEDLVKMVPVAKSKGIAVVSIDGADGWAWGSCLMSSLVARMTGDLQWVEKAVKGEKKFTDPDFVAALAMLQRIVKDGVIDSKSLTVDYGANISNFSNKKALFMVQGQWAAGDIAKEVQDVTTLMAWPVFPGEKASGGNSVAAAMTVGYGLTKKGGENKAVREAALKFIDYFNSEAEVTQRLKDGAIVAPVLKGYVAPSDLAPIMVSKVKVAQSTKVSQVIDAYLTGAPNDALNAGMQKIVAGKATPAEIAAEVEKLARK